MDNEAKAQKNSDRLARVRENQRKSRARKQVYVRELEQRVAAIQQETRQMDITNRIVLQKMETENHLIKNLIMSLGVSADSVKRYLQLADQNTVADRKVAIPAAMDRSVEARSVASCQSPCSTLSSQMTTGVSVGGKDSVEQPTLYDYAHPTSTIPTLQSIQEQQNCPMAISTAIGRPVEARSIASCQFPCPTSSQVTSSVRVEGKDFVEQASSHDYALSTKTIPTQQFIEEQQKCPVSPSCQKSTIDQHASEPQPDHQNTLNTTLCIAAEELLDQHNAQGIHMDDLRRRICPGVEETDLGCCRVQNDVLFQILDEISNLTLH